MIELALIAVFAGVLSFLSPCVFPLVPLYIAYFSGVNAENKSKKKLVLNVLAFIMGFTVIYLMLGLSVSFFISFMQRYYVFKLILGVLMIVFALHFWKVLRIPILYSDTRNINIKKFNVASSFIFGVLFAFGWSPCIGPLLGNVLILAANANGLYGKVVVLLMFCVGLIIPFLLVAFMSEGIRKKVKGLNKYSRYVEFVSGVLLFVVGIWVLVGN